jgi:hypothetical protein
MSSYLFPFQRDCVSFGLRAGSWGLFLDTGLGKTACELEWARHVANHEGGRVLLLTPLAVARQIEREAHRWGYDAKVIREQEDADAQICICNYDRLDKLTPSVFCGIVLDESSILKSFTGKTTRLLIDTFASHRWRMAATATPAPNDHMELGQHSEFLGVLTQSEMLIRWFVNDSANTGTWRLKKHATDAFWNWMASWSRMAEHPRDLGDSVSGYDLPPLTIHRHGVETTVRMDGMLFANDAVSATSMHDIKRQTADARAEVAMALALADTSPWIIWCDTDYEADALMRCASGYDDVSEVRGSFTADRKEDTIAAFDSGSVRVLVTKPSVCGFGLNWQHCSNVVFVGRSFSYESWYQAVRRCWRFGQTKPVNVHLVVATGEEHIGRVIDRKAGDHSRMKRAMTGAMLRAMGRTSAQRIPYKPEHVAPLPRWI